MNAACCCDVLGDGSLDGDDDDDGDDEDDDDDNDDEDDNSDDDDEDDDLSTGNRGNYHTNKQYDGITDMVKGMTSGNHGECG